MRVYIDGEEGTGSSGRVAMEEKLQLNDLPNIEATWAAPV